MAMRELSSTLRNLKFMQRAGLREEQPKKEEEVKPDGNFSSPGIANRKCVVVMEADPHPGAIMGRKSFLSFNPSIEKLNEEAANPHQPATSTTSWGNQSENKSTSLVIMEGDPHPAVIKGRMSFQNFNPFIDKLIARAANPRPPATSTTSSGNQNEKMSTRENGYSDMNKQNRTTNGDLKRKQSDVGSETQTQPFGTFPRNLQYNQSSTHNAKKGSFKKPKRERPNWNVLRPPKNLK